MTSRDQANCRCRWARCRQGRIEAKSEAGAFAFAHEAVIVIVKPEGLLDSMQPLGEPGQDALLAQADTGEFCLSICLQPFEFS